MTTNLPTLFIGNKNYSSWSMRPWLTLRWSGIGFNEVLIPLGPRGAGINPEIAAISPSSTLPALKLPDGETIWDTMSICEWAHETKPDAKLWPEDPVARALARSASAEMHSGFMALRSECGMNLHRPIRAVELSADAQANVARVQAIWAECHRRYGKDGLFLFGAFSGADVMFAPVVHRFRTYAIPVADEARHYVDAMNALPAFAEWTRDGLAETLLIDRFETI